MGQDGGKATQNEAEGLSKPLASDDGGYEDTSRTRLAVLSLGRPPISLSKCYSNDQGGRHLTLQSVGRIGPSYFVRDRGWIGFKLMSNRFGSNKRLEYLYGIG
ncbi:hypothetical protein ElyMa_000398200 [Elysia marginata]|uniref:Uncharacterized protein n=1 Tax=Elysia marginata TaxID=1093978 RepID=A0AAV4FLK6_9GAST|nr:hypothetical protein ElyMa_000398200 [Elysia marginata]